MGLLNTFTRVVFLAFLAFALADPIPDVDYDAIIVGGGPAGLSALSALGRVRRSALMYDSGEYRNGATRHMHDVIGNDGAVPAEFRGLAREQIAKYNTTEIKDTAVLSVEQKEDHFRVTDDQEGVFTCRKVVLGTGLKDILPDTPGLEEGWANGIFWCPWCDGYEHRDQPFGILGHLKDVMGSVVEMWTLNTDIIAFVNGTHTPEEEEALVAKNYTNWKEQLEAYNVRLDNRTITSIDRIQSGEDVNDPENHLEYDVFQINFDEGESVIRNAFITNFPSEQRSTIPTDLGLKMNKNKIDVSIGDMRTSMAGVFAVGDANDDGSTNVPHAMFSAKRAVVYLHVELAREDSLASIGKRGVQATRRQLEKEARRAIGENLDPLWKRAGGV